MPMWNPWRGCHKCSEGCKFCYIHKGDAKHGIDTDLIVRTAKMTAPIEKYKRGEHTGEYKIKAGEIMYVCFSSDFLIEEADLWREECWKIIKERADLNFVFLTKRIDRFSECIPSDWGDGYENVTVGCTIENQKMADYRLSIFDKLPIKHKNIICQPLIEDINIEKHLSGVELVMVGGESDRSARPLDYNWVLSIREQCIKHNVKFDFHQCGTKFIKDKVVYNLNPMQLVSQAKKANINT
jgi:protein gp37